MNKVVEINEQGHFGQTSSENSCIPIWELTDRAGQTGQMRSHLRTHRSKNKNVTGTVCSPKRSQKAML